MFHHWPRSLLGCGLAASVACGPVDVPAFSRVAEREAPLEISMALVLDRDLVRPGDTQIGSVTYRNARSSAVYVEKIVIAMRRPRATHAAGPYDDAEPQPGPLDIGPGETVQVVARREFGAADPEGVWEAYSTVRDRDGVWHDGPSVFFDVAAHSPPAADDAGVTPEV